MGAIADAFVSIHPGRKRQRLLLETDSPDHDQWLLQAVARAMHWTALLDSGAYRNAAAIARAEGIHEMTVGRTLYLARLAPDVIERLLQGRAPRQLTLRWLMHHKIPDDWSEQRRVLAQFG